MGKFYFRQRMNSGRFLDPPEFAVIHDKGNEENIFDRVDFQLSTRGFGPRESGLHALLVPDAEFIRQPEYAA